MNNVSAYALRLGDNGLVLSQRLGAWCGHAPELEIDLALANIGLDLLGQARNFLTYAAEREGKGDEDTLAYGRDERQFRNLFKKAESKSGVTGEILLQLLECRLDNVVYRLGLAPTRAAARQLVSHKHITVDGKVVNIPSFSVQPGQVVAVREKAKSLEVIESALAGFNHSKYPWIEWDENVKGGKFLHTPERADIPENIKEQMIVELYSK